MAGEPVKPPEAKREDHEMPDNLSEDLDPTATPIGAANEHHPQPDRKPGGGGFGQLAEALRNSGAVQSAAEEAAAKIDEQAAGVDGAEQVAAEAKAAVEAVVEGEAGTEQRELQFKVSSGSEAAVYRVDETKEDDKYGTPNEDAVYTNADVGLFAVLDGMGGTGDGHLGSKTANEAFQKATVENPKYVQAVQQGEVAKVTEFLREAAKIANQAVLDLNSRGTGTTLAMVQVVKTEQGARAIALSCGDSKLGIRRGDQIIPFGFENRILGIYEQDPAKRRQLEHALDGVESEAELDAHKSEHPFIRYAWNQRAKIAEALGQVGGDHDYQVEMQDLQEGDELFGLSDGISDVLSSRQIREALVHGDDMVAAARKANEDKVFRAKDDDATFFKAEVTGLVAPEKKTGFDPLEDMFEADSDDAAEPALPDADTISTELPTSAVEDTESFNEVLEQDHDNSLETAEPPPLKLEWFDRPLPPSPELAEAEAAIDIATDRLHQVYNAAKVEALLGQMEGDIVKQEQAKYIDSEIIKFHDVQEALDKLSKLVSAPAIRELLLNNDIDTLVKILNGEEVKGIANPFLDSYDKLFEICDATNLSGSEILKMAKAQVEAPGVDAEKVRQQAELANLEAIDANEELKKVLDKFSKRSSDRSIHERLLNNDLDTLLKMQNREEIDGKATVLFDEANVQQLVEMTGLSDREIVLMAKAQAEQLERKIEQLTRAKDSLGAQFQGVINATAATIKRIDRIAEGDNLDALEAASKGGRSVGALFGGLKTAAKELLRVPTVRTVLATGGLIGASFTGFGVPAVAAMGAYRLWEHKQANKREKANRKEVEKEVRAALENPDSLLRKQLTHSMVVNAAEAKQAQLDRAMQALRSDADNEEIFSSQQNDVIQKAVQEALGLDGTNDAEYVDKGGKRYEAALAALQTLEDKHGSSNPDIDVDGIYGRSEAKQGWLARTASSIAGYKESSYEPKSMQKKVRDTALFTAAAIAVRTSDIPVLRQAMGAFAGARLADTIVDWRRSKQAQAERTAEDQALMAKLREVASDPASLSSGEAVALARHRLSDVTFQREHSELAGKLRVELRKAESRMITAATDAMESVDHVTAHMEQALKDETKKRDGAKLKRMGVHLAGAAGGFLLASVIGSGAVRDIARSVQDASLGEQLSNWFGSDGVRSELAATITASGVTDTAIEAGPTYGEDGVLEIQLRSDVTDTGGTEPPGPGSSAPEVATPSEPDPAVEPAEPDATPEKTGTEAVASEAPAVATSSASVEAAPAAPAEAAPAEVAASATEAEPAAGTVVQYEATSDGGYTTPDGRTLTAEQVKIATVEQGKGFSTVIQRQIEADPASFGLEADDKAGQAELLAKIMRETKFNVDGKNAAIFDPAAGEQLWVIGADKYMIDVHMVDGEVQLDVIDTGTNQSILGNEAAIDKAFDVKSSRAAVPEIVRVVPDASAPVVSVEQTATAETNWSPAAANFLAEHPHFIPGDMDGTVDGLMAAFESAHPNPDSLRTADGLYSPEGSAALHQFTQQASSMESDFSSVVAAGDNPGAEHLVGEPATADALFEKAIHRGPRGMNYARFMRLLKETMADSAGQTIAFDGIRFVPDGAGGINMVSPSGEMAELSKDTFAAFKESGRDGTVDFDQIMAAANPAEATEAVAALDTFTTPSGTTIVLESGSQEKLSAMGVDTDRLRTTGVLGATGSEVLDLGNIHASTVTLSVESGELVIEATGEERTIAVSGGSMAEIMEKISG